MLTLYYGSGSPYAWRVNLALEHKALPYERRVLSFAAAHADEVWGIKNLNREVMAILNQWARFLYRPLMEDS